MLGNELGQLKYELDGGYIEEIIILGIKRYAYRTYKGIVKTVFSGVEIDALTWDLVLAIANHETIKVQSKDHFYKSLPNFQVQIKDRNLELAFNTEKILKGNNYQNIIINNTSLSANFLLRKLYSNLKKFKTFLKKDVHLRQRLTYK